jgi:hypothetical protein
LSEERVEAMRPEFTGSRWATLQAEAHLLETQAVIRREISRGIIRVVPAPGGGIRIIPTSGISSVEEPEPTAAVGLVPEAQHRRDPSFESKGSPDEQRS